ncbi:SGNH/GDSL hydrolase family protein [Candidatus Curtissbacteria bacterium]|nr:SGNH/GDSL hydrolase family protein [Candidatus Curtissbacteria bacterium]
MTRKKELAGRFVFASLSLVAALLVFEVLLRIFTSEPQNLAKLKASLVFLHENKANATFAYSRDEDGFNNTISINSYGFRDDEFKKEKDPNVFRIAVLGDSQEEALQVKLADTWQKVMAKKLSSELVRKAAIGEPRFTRVESYNFGVSGYGTDQQWLTLREKVWQFSPDMVILAFSPNDVGDTFKNGLARVKDGKLEVISAKERAGGNILGRLARETYTYHLIVKSASGSELTKRLIENVRVKILGFPKEERFFQSDAQLVQGPFEVIASQKNPPKEVGDTWKIVEALIFDMQKQAEGHGAKFLITINIPRAQVSPSGWESLMDQYHLDPAVSSPQEINDVLAGFAREAGITVYDPREEAVAWTGDFGILHFRHDGHFNVNGNLFMGTKVADFILANDLIR